MLALSSADWNQMVAFFFFPLVRILAWLGFDPLLGNRATPATIRLGLAVVLTLVIAPTLPPPPQVALLSGEGLLLLLQQIAIGLALGFAIRIVFTTLEFAGQFMGLQMGLSMATLYDPVNGAQTPVLAQFLTITSILTLFAINGHHQIIAALWQGFRDVPIALTPSSGHGFLVLAGWGAAIFKTGLHIALPVTAALLSANLAIGMMTRAAPQLNIFAVGFPITISAGFLVLYFSILYLPAYLERFWGQAVEAGGAAMRGMVAP
ncbi:flagellar biosynthetic protein FliR [Parasulfuritortus cantonensis]|uniref:Flagellar biosynthetic protein FliR n=1 Tax=Parasulfuritortus cantonensis TaxID=2528202 RepID=A0A4V2NVH1_9PROT|nr:flagellar biosynthetic protein FliR [Parasulfuritortus cantonensis]TCJ13466.1 flagellar biosynthetic protein FliR [Parasulfuritortus cantonensis]